VGKGVVYVVSHELETATPVVDVEVCVAEPGVSITGAAAPFGLGHVVVEMDVDLLLCELGGNGIIHLFCASVKKNSLGYIHGHTWSLVVEAPNCGLFLITFLYAASPLLPNAFWNAFCIVTSPP
jgi:hypothetical protein